jgi:hypothetical protein
MDGMELVWWTDLNAILYLGGVIYGVIQFITLQAPREVELIIIYGQCRRVYSDIQW